MYSYAFLNDLKTAACFNRKDLQDAMSQGGEPVGDALLKFRLQDLLKKGEIIRVGRNAYCVPEETVYPYEYDYSDEAKEIAGKIQEAHPYLEFMVFEMVQLNEFVNHQLAHNVIFVSVEGDLGDFVFDTLKESYPGKILLNPTPEIYHQYWYDGMVVIERLTTEAPKDKNNIWASRIEKILVDIQADTLMLNALSKSEYPLIYGEAFHKYAIDESCLFRYAKRRGVEKKILEFIHNKTDIKLRTRR